MKGSLRRRSFVWMSAAIVLTSASVAALSFMLAWRDASEVSDARLRQVTASLAAQQTRAPMSHASLENGGGGLGLATVRSAAQALGGRVELGTRGDGGSGPRVTYTQKIA